VNGYLIKNIRMINADGEVVSDRNERFTDTLNDEGYRFPPHKLGARIFADVDFPKDMTDAEIGKMTRLSKVMIGKTNMLGYRKSRNILAYSSQEIAEMVNLKDRQGRAFISKMLLLKVISKVDVNNKPQYYINPAYFMASGQRLSLDLFLLFKDDIAPMIPKWVLTSFLMQAQEKKV
jgi:hypothetical protein